MHRRNIPWARQASFTFGRRYINDNVWLGDVIIARANTSYDGEPRTSTLDVWGPQGSFQVAIIWT